MEYAPPSTAFERDADRRLRAIETSYEQRITVLEHKIKDLEAALVDLRKNTIGLRTRYR